MNTDKSFLELIKQSIVDDELVRLTLSKPRKNRGLPQKIIIRLVIIKHQQHLSFTRRYATNDSTENYPVEEGIGAIGDLMWNEFLIARLFTTKKDVEQTYNKKGKMRQFTLPATFRQKPERTHNKNKKRLMTSDLWLRELEVMDAKGRIRKDMGDKYRQISKFLEIIDGLVRNQPALLQKKNLYITDMGAGKGYLTFALYDYFYHQHQLEANITGVEIRKDLVKKCNGVARKVGFEKLHFEEGYISDFSLPQTDILLALHACDTATDDAIFKGIQANAELIICAPCCHKQIRKAMGGSRHLQPILDFGILKERQAEIITDTLRALLMERKGYSTNVFEFVSTEHTGKNLMIAGNRTKKLPDQQALITQIETIKKEFAIPSHYLEELLFGAY